ncbi:FG-GAP-like repeat-containing protein [Rhodopirellula sp. P2]|uniref:FG-GAP-like repeat-containing protein n=1 Tax=Rhodopirellula sp. P2 TaxID=2127060 RepID=UPI002368DE9F|nr:FG-GAP-like repeat-containing protein [Rhodopirellula sp. P2]WDQ15693.1 FG-GAP-like repeat-containing protein [Rhodopirellula sp. P2]
MKSGDLQAAWENAQEVLITHQDDPQALEEIASIAFAVDQKQIAVDLLMDATRKSEFASAAQVQRTVVGLISIGRVMDAIELLSTAVQQVPTQHESRRLLFDLWTGLGDRFAALPHGQALVQQRQIDQDLLLGISNTRARVFEIESMVAMVDRHAGDNRPWLAHAEWLFDRGQFAEAEDVLQKILKQDPGFAPAQILLGRTLIGQAKWEHLESWQSSLDAECTDRWEYWSVMGDWASEKGHIESAARCFWEGTQRNAMVMQLWQKLARAIRESSVLQPENTHDSPWSTDLLDSIQERITLLERLHQAEQQIVKPSGKNVETYLELTETHAALGRLWEAEAWAALGIRQLQPASSELTQARQQVLGQLHRQTPWQIRERQPALQLDLGELPAVEFSFASKNAVTDRDWTATEWTTPQLRNEAIERGLDFFGRTSDALDQPGILLSNTLGCGGGALDLDLDGWSDLVLAAAGGHPGQNDSSSNGWFRNLDGQFISMTKHAGTIDQAFGQGIAVGDANSDGFPDVLSLNYGVNQLWINQGDGTFQESSDRFLSAYQNWSTSGAIADLDGDGLADMVVVNYCDGFDPSTNACTTAGGTITRACAPTRFPAGADEFWKGLPDGRFVEVSSRWSAQPDILGRGLGLLIGSIDSQAGLDIFVANDMTPNHYYSSQSTGDDDLRLRESAMISGLATDANSNAQGSMGIACWDCDGDERLDLLVTNFEREYNTLHSQYRDGLWKDATPASGLVTPTWPMVGFGCQAIDFGNDSRAELVVTNGHTDFPVDEEEIWYAQPFQLFRQTEWREFDLVQDDLGDEYFSKEHVGRALWVLDVNRDGKQDFVVTHQTEPVALMMNQTQTEHSWIRFELRGTHSATDAIGAKVKTRYGNRFTVSAVTAGDGYLCSNERTVHIGLGDYRGTVDVTIEWPDGSTQSYQGLSTKSEWMCVQGQPPFLCTH